MKTRLFTFVLIAFFVLSCFTSSKYQNNRIPVEKGMRGFWQVVEDNRGVWWFCSPSGQLEFVNAVTTIQPMQIGQDPNGISFHSSDYVGDIDNWADKTVNRVENAGFNASGAWSNPAIRKYIPYSKDLNLLKSSRVPITHPDWEMEMEDTIKNEVEPLKDDRNLIGYYLDNELLWDSDKVLTANAEKYFETTSRLIRKYDPNHLILGVRFNHRAPLEVIYAMKGRVDVESVNVYSDTGSLWANNVRELYEITNSPVIVSEFSFWAVQNNSGDKSNKAWWVGEQTQSERATMYRQFVLGVADNSFMIGCDFFQWSDEPPSGRFPDGEDLNCGIVSVKDLPYPEMIDAARYVSSRMDKIHANSDDRQLDPIWKTDPKRP